jgi:uncharacterized membrane protein YhaH (DUF805 family)
MQYFLSTLGLAVVMTVISFGIAGYLFRQTPKGMLPSVDQFTLPVICATLLFVWATFNLQAMRIRDIGWDPVVIIPAWISVLVIDGLVAAKVPAWAVGHGDHQTIVGALVNLALFGILLFWPSGDIDYGPMPTSDELSRTPTGPDGPRPAAPPMPRGIPTMRTEFGRRSLY